MRSGVSALPLRARPLQGSSMRGADLQQQLNASKDDANVLKSRLQKTEEEANLAKKQLEAAQNSLQAEKDQNKRTVDALAAPATAFG